MHTVVYDTVVWVLSCTLGAWGQSTLACSEPVFEGSTSSEEALKKKTRGLVLSLGDIQFGPWLWLLAFPALCSPHYD